MRRHVCWVSREKSTPVSGLALARLAQKQREIFFTAAARVLGDTGNGGHRHAA
jgi:hypothetical protein